MPEFTTVTLCRCVECGHQQPEDWAEACEECGGTEFEPLEVEVSQDRWLDVLADHTEISRKLTS